MSETVSASSSTKSVALSRVIMALLKEPGIEVPSPVACWIEARTGSIKVSADVRDKRITLNGISVDKRDLQADSPAARAHIEDRLRSLPDNPTMLIHIPQAVAEPYLQIVQKIRDPSWNVPEETVLSVDSASLEFYWFDGQWRKLDEGGRGGCTNPWALLAYFGLLKERGASDGRIKYDPRIGDPLPGEILNETLDDVLTTFKTTLHTKEVFRRIGIVRGIMRKVLGNVGATSVDREYFRPNRKRGSYVLDFPVATTTRERGRELYLRVMEDLARQNAVAPAGVAAEPERVEAVETVTVEAAPAAAPKPTRRAPKAK